jgi:cell wall-associated protease
MIRLVFRGLGALALLFLSAAGLLAQSSSNPADDWFLKDPETDLVQGVSTERVYQTLLKDQPARTVIVAVIDSGVDIQHEDLKDVIWINEDEIPDNGKDDDKNGYVDDVHGWNFIGGKNGNVNEDTYELTREYVRLKTKFDGLEKIGKKQKAEYEQYQKLKDKYLKLKEKNAKEYQFYKSIYINASGSVDTLKAVLKTDTLTREKVAAYAPTEPALLFAKGMVLNLYRNMDENDKLEDVLAQLKEGYDYFRVISEYGYNDQFNSREIIGDDINNVHEKYYGNNDVKGADAKHGTHVAGIIAANRNNALGIKGIADHVRIMAIRAVPNGDERDKDIANAIYYAVDNGAHIINMSFGKSFSPQKEIVDKAVKYAEQKGVLLVHAAGNDADDNDVEPNFPNRYYQDGKEVKTWIEIGASAWGTEDLVGNFSNYGKKSVDLFAPGVMIYSTTPENKYEHLQGTSMASPVVAGVAAILMSYFPNLSATDVKEILRKSTRQFNDLEVNKPGTRSKSKLSDISITGGLVNAFEAVMMAQTYHHQKIVK